MKATVCKVLDINQPEKDFFGVKITNGRGKKPQFVYDGTQPFCTDDESIAIAKAREVNRKLVELNIQ